MSNKTGKKCGKCGADVILNPNTGKEFCEKKCWLDNSTQKFQSNNSFNKSYDLIKDSKIEKMFDEKQGNIKWLNALNNACLLVANKVIVPSGSVSGCIQDIANKIYSMEAPKSETKPETPVIQTIQIEDLGEEINPDNIPF